MAATSEDDFKDGPEDDSESDPEDDSESGSECGSESGSECGSKCPFCIKKEEYDACQTNGEFHYALFDNGYDTLDTAGACKYVAHIPTRPSYDPVVRSDPRLLAFVEVAELKGATIIKGPKPSLVCITDHEGNECFDESVMPFLSKKEQVDNTMTMLLKENEALKQRIVKLELRLAQALNA